MIRRWVLVLLALAAGAAVAVLFRGEGTVLVSYRQWLLEASLSGFLVLMLLSMLALYGLIKFGARALELPSRLRRAARRRRADQARDSFELGLLKLLEGNWRGAEIELVRRAADHHAQHLNYLAAARAAQRLGAGERRDHYLKLATQCAPELEFAVLLTQAELQRERGEHALARDTALSLRARDAQHPYAIELLAESYASLEQWAPLRELLLATAKTPALSPVRQQALLLRALTALMARAVAEAKLDQLKALWDSAPAAAQADPLLRRTCARGLARLNAQADSAALCSKTLSREWDGPLAQLYGELHVNDPLGQLAVIEQWLQQYGEKPELLMTAGRACRRNKLWGKARSYLEAVLRSTPNAAAHLELARLCEQTNNADEARKHYQLGLELAASEKQFSPQMNADKHG